MPETSAAKTAFAPALPSLNSRSYSAEVDFVPSYSRTGAFNHDITTEQLKPLLEDCPTPGRKFRLVGAWGASGICGLVLLLWLVLWATARLRGVHFDFRTGPAVGDGDYAFLNVVGAVLLVVMFAATAAWLTGTLMNFVARKEWSSSLLAAWYRYDGHIVWIRDLPEDRQQPVNRLGRLLDDALENLDANDRSASLLNLAARTAIARYFELPARSQAVERVARSTVNDPLVQGIREQYQAATVIENVALSAAEDAVRAVQDYADKVKAAAADQDIIELAKALDRSRF